MTLFILPAAGVPAAGLTASPDVGHTFCSAQGVKVMVKSELLYT